MVDSSPFSDDDPAPDEAVDYTQIDAGRARFLLAALAVLAAPFLIDAPIVAILKNSHTESIAMYVLESGMIVKFALMSIWLAWGRSRVFWRMLILAVSWLFTAMIIAGSHQDFIESFATFYLFMIVSAAFIALPRLFGVRWITGWSGGYTQLKILPRNYQFSIADLLAWTTATALVAGILGIVGRPRGYEIEFFVVLLIACGVLDIGILAVLWAQLTISEKSVHRSLFVLAAMTALPTVVLSLMFGAPGQMLGYILATSFTTTSLLLLACGALRAAGHRLVRRKVYSTPLPPAPLASPPAVPER